MRSPPRSGSWVSTVPPAVLRPRTYARPAMTELGPMPPTPDVGPVAADAGSLEPVAPGVWVWLGTDGRGRPGPNVGRDRRGRRHHPDRHASRRPSAARALNQAAAALRGADPPGRLHLQPRRVGRRVRRVLDGGPLRAAPDQRAVRAARAPSTPTAASSPGYAHDYDDEFATRPVSHVVDAAAWLTPLVCAVPVRGHQEQNLVVLVPSAGRALRGAVVPFGTTPNAYDGDPEAWADTLGELREQADGRGPGRRSGGRSRPPHRPAGLPLRRRRRRRRRPPHPRRTVGRLDRPGPRRGERRARRPPGGG